MKARKLNAPPVYLHPAVSQRAEVEALQKRIGQLLIIIGQRSSAPKPPAPIAYHDDTDPWGGDAA